MDLKRLAGTGVALVTPFTRSGEVDFPALGRVVDRAIDGGVDFLVALGTTAETPTLTPDERDRVLDYIRRRNAARRPLVVGVGGNSTAAVVESLRSCDLAGVDAVLSVTPYYNRPSQEGLYRHYRALAEASPLPVILYNVPKRTGVNLEPDTVLRLARDCAGRIVGLKAASGDLAQIGRVIAGRPAGFLVLSGDDSLALDVIAAGGDGIISVAANAWPQPFAHMIRAARSGECEAASRLCETFGPLLELLTTEGSPAGVKGALAVQGAIENVLRLPLVEASAELLARLREAQRTAGF